MSEKIYKDYTEEDLKQHFNENGFTIQDLSIKGKLGNVRITCERGHELDEKLSVALKRKSCVRCTSLHYRDNLEERLSANGFKLLEYNSDLRSYSEVEVICKEGHIIKGVLDNYVRSFGCKVCSGQEVQEQTVKSNLASRGFTLVDTYTRINNPHTLIHEKCGKSFTVNTLGSIHRGESGCPHCNFKVRKDRSEIESILLGNNWKLCELHEEHLYTKGHVTLECTECGFSRVGILANYLYQSIKCPDCTDRTYYKMKDDSPAILYYVKISHLDEVYYKVGITADDIATRFYKDLRRSEINIKELSILQCDTRLKARTLERHFLTTFSEYRYRGSPILLSGGNTELFTEDVLELDT